MPSKEPIPGTRGFIIPIGGAEDKIADRRILKRFIGLCGGRDSPIVVVPTASEAEDTGERYVDVFDRVESGPVRVVNIRTRREADDPALIALLDDAAGVFFTGGNQLRLTTILGGTDFAQAVRKANARGVHVAGTSAGASFVSGHMIAGGREGGTPKAGMVTLAPGLGLTTRVVIDQHFRERDRIGRLLTAIAYNPYAIGLGIDEDTAAFIGPDKVFEVVGRGGITVVDANDCESSSMARAGDGHPVELVGVKLNILINGSRFDLIGRRVLARG